MPPPSLAGLELRRLKRSRLTRGALVVVLLVPLLYGALYLWSFWDPYSRLDKLPVALVNEDRGATVGQRKVHAGDDLERALIERRTFAWHVVDAAEADQGLRSGKYYMTLTMPPTFSRRLVSPSGDHPRPGALQLRTNDANNYVVGQISRAAFAEVRTAASIKTAHGYLDQIFISFGNLHDATQKAANGAAQIADGLARAGSGADRLAAGASRLAGGARRLENGAGQLEDGLARAATGSRDLARGLARLDAGAGRLADGSRRVAGGTRQLATRVNDVARRVLPVLRDDATAIGDAAGVIADGAATVASALGRAGTVSAAGAAAADRGTQAVQGAITEADARHPGEPHPALDGALTAATAAAALAHQADDTVHRDAARLAELERRARMVSVTARRISTDAPALAGRAQNAVDKINQLDAGAHRVATGAAQLHAGTTRAAGGSRTLADGITRLHDGSIRLHDGLQQLRSGAGRLAGGARQLQDGLARLAAGSRRLADGLAQGAKRIPDYSKDEREQRADVMSDPVRLAKSALNPAKNYGTGFAPYFIPLSLWVGIMIAFTILRPLSPRAMASNAGAWRVALIGFFPAAAIGILQALVLLAVLRIGIGLDVANPWGVTGFLIATVLCFVAIQQWLLARFGVPGRLLAVVLLTLQLTSGGGTYPIETSPDFFQALHPFLPMTYVITAMRHLVSGGDAAPVWQAVVVLAAFTAGALLLTTAAARRLRVWTVTRLHPELAT